MGMVWRLVTTTVTKEGMVGIDVRRFPTKSLAVECGEAAMDAVDRTIVKHADYTVETVCKEVPR